MKLINSSLFIEFSEMVSAICSSSGKSQENVDKYLRKANSIGTNGYGFTKDPDDKRRVLLSYEDMSNKNQTIIQQWLRLKLNCKHSTSERCTCGDPYHFIANRPLLESIKWDDKAESYFLAYEYQGPTGKDKMPYDKVRKLTLAASILNTIIEAEVNPKKNIKEKYGLSHTDYLERMCEIIRNYISEGKLERLFPTKYITIRRRISAYKKEGYPNLIDHRLGNQSAAKILRDDISSDLLLALIEDHRQFDDVFVSQRYNEKAIELGYKEIDAATVGVWRRKKDWQIKLSREGSSVWAEKYRREIPGMRPSIPGLLWEHDDNHLDFLYVDFEDKTSSKYYHRYKAIVVTDSYNDYVLGYAYSENLSTELVKAAYANAMYHLKELTGTWYLPHEVKSDKWSLTALKPFYESMGHYFESPVGSKKRGFIEQFFRTPHWKRCQKLASEYNWTGNNITAVNRGVNIEVIDLNKKSRPAVGQEACNQLEYFFQLLRTMPQTNGKSKQEEWLEAWINVSGDQKRQISDEKFLSIFGIKHQPRNGELPSINPVGIEVQINNRKYLYNVPPALRLINTGKKVQLIYDSYDMNRILVTDGNNLRFIAESQQRVPKALGDHFEGSRQFLNDLLSEGLNDVNTVTSLTQERRSRLEAAMIDTEALLLSQALPKQIKQAAENAFLIPASNSSNNYNALDQM